MGVASYFNFGRQRDADTAGISGYPRDVTAPLEAWSNTAGQDTPKVADAWLSDNESVDGSNNHSWTGGPGLPTIKVNYFTICIET